MGIDLAMPMEENSRRDRIRKCIRKYFKSEKGREKMRQAQQRYNKTPRGRERNKRWREGLSEERKAEIRERERERMRQKRAVAKAEKLARAAEILGMEPSDLLESKDPLRQVDLD